jgi:hypothetical protein
MKTFTVGANDYQAERLDAFKQLTICRKMSPIIFAQGSAITIVNGEPVYNPTILSATLADIPEQDMQLLIETILPVVSIEVGDKAFPIYNKEAKVMLYDTISGADIYLILWEVAMEYLPDFMVGAGLISTPAPTTNN